MTAYRNLVLVGLVALAGCSSNDSSQRSTPGDDAGTPIDPLAAELCAPACDAVKGCRPAGDVDACRTQCAKELAGEGYLNPEFAKEFFRELKEHGPGTNCYTLAFTPWYGDPTEPSNYDAGSHDVSILQECYDGKAKCDALVVKSDCFTNYYVWNTSYRQAIKACWAGPCASQPDCMKAARAPLCGMPWLAIPPDPNSLLDRTCLPPDAGGI